MLFLSKVFFGVIGVFVGLFLGLAAGAAIMRSTVGHFLELAEPDVEPEPLEDDNLGDESLTTPAMAAALHDAQRAAKVIDRAPSEDRSCVTYH